MEPELMISPNGTKEWWLNGKRHRTDGPAIEGINGAKQWWLNNQRHRADGPAIEDSIGTKQWYLNGKIHRTDGPAIEGIDGTKQWWLNDKKYSFANWCEQTNKSPAEITLLLLKYGY